MSPPPADPADVAPDIFAGGALRLTHDFPEILPPWLSMCMPKSGYIPIAQLAGRWLDCAYPERVRVELLDHGPLPVLDPVSSPIGEVLDEIGGRRPSRPDVRVSDMEAGARRATHAAFVPRGSSRFLDKARGVRLSPFQINRGSVLLNSSFLRS